MKPIHWVISLVGGGGLMWGGPALVRYVSPTEEELFKKYNPDLQRRSLENREDRLREANEFVAKLKEYAADGRPIWTVQKEDELRQKILKRRADNAKKDEKRSIADEIRRQRLQGDGDSEG